MAGSSIRTSGTTPELPEPDAAAPDLVSPAFEHMLAYGDMDELTEERLASAVKLDISQIAAASGPTLESLRKMLEERKRKILETYGDRERSSRTRPEPSNSRPAATHAAKEHADASPPRPSGTSSSASWSGSGTAPGGERSRFARELLKLVDKLGEKYQIDELAGKYEFTGHAVMSRRRGAGGQGGTGDDRPARSSSSKKAKKNAQIAMIDLSEMRPVRERRADGRARPAAAAGRTAPAADGRAAGSGKVRPRLQDDPKAYRIFQGHLLEQIFSQLQASRSGRHQGPIVGEGAVELPTTKDYEFGDSGRPNGHRPVDDERHRPRRPAGLPLRMKAEDIVIHRTRNNPKCATAVC